MASLCYILLNKIVSLIPGVKNILTPAEMTDHKYHESIENPCLNSLKNTAVQLILFLALCIKINNPCLTQIFKQISPLVSSLDLQNI